MTPYLIIDNEMMTALTYAAKEVLMLRLYYHIFQIKRVHLC